jgi:hypothetical protein
MTVTSGNGKSSLHKQNVSVCFFSEQKCTYLKNFFFDSLTLKLLGQYVNLVGHIVAYS